MKLCPKCHTEQSLESFPKSRTRKSGIYPYCKSCCTKRSREYKRKFPEKETAYNHKRKLASRKKIRDYLRGKGCQICGETDPVVLQFHHLRDKEANVSNLISNGRKWERVLEEIEKCQILCANCHFRKTAKERGRFDYL